jgi:hypothetical protein
MIDQRHDENPPEMRCLVAVRTGRGAAIRRYGYGKSALDSTSIP